VNAARRAAGSQACLADYWVLPAQRFGGTPARLVLAAVATDRHSADAEMTRPCDKPVRRRNAVFRPNAPGNKE
jgi:hypothetical protein